jgi:DEAD/DEAH box helicase domain-containing protein
LNGAPAEGGPKTASDKSQSIRAYRSGYLPRQRREIEQGLRQGHVRAVVATTALELGIDIGSMGAAVLAGYPGTIAGTWQQAGRAGRQTEAALAVLVTSANPLDQFLAHHPDYFFERSPEQALINPNNLLILLQHVRCAAFELPFQAGDQFGQVAADQLAELLQFLHQGGELHRSGTKYFWLTDRYPAEQVSLRSASPQTVRLQVVQEDSPTWTTIGEVDLASAPWMVHPQAVYLHEGQTFVVEALDLEQYVARLRPTRVDYYTEPKRETTVQLVSQLAQVAVNGGTKHHGEIIVTTQVVGYRMVQWFTQARLGQGQVDLPPSELHTTGYWLGLAPELVARLREQGLWSNDPNDYGPNWAEQRRRARARDNYCCQMCGAPEENREHDVHHQIPFRRFDSYQQANRLANLITLCRACHGRVETAVRMRSGLSGLATALGHLAPLFLMCDPHDVGIHADPKLPLAEDQPGVVIYDMIPAGIGFSERLFELHDTLVRQTTQLVTACPCPTGCPSCVGPAGEAGSGGKQETLAILEGLV